jgi:hypothetical protein
MGSMRIRDQSCVTETVAEPSIASRATSVAENGFSQNAMIVNPTNTTAPRIDSHRLYGRSGCLTAHTTVAAPATMRPI